MLSQKPWLPRAAASRSCWLLAGAVAGSALAAPAALTVGVTAMGCTSTSLSVGG
ncbi:hypothetical protein D3C76_1813890 [compost metagenome]